MFEERKRDNSCNILPQEKLVLSLDFDGTLNGDGALEPKLIEAMRIADILKIPTWIVTARDMASTLNNVCNTLIGLLSLAMDPLDEESGQRYLSSILKAIRINRLSRALEDIEGEKLCTPKISTDLDAILPINEQGEYYKKLEKVLDFFEDKAKKALENKAYNAGKQIHEEMKTLLNYIFDFSQKSVYKLILVKDLNERTIKKMIGKSGLQGNGVILDNGNKAHIFVNGELIKLQSQSGAQKPMIIEMDNAVCLDGIRDGSEHKECKSSELVDKVIKAAIDKARRQQGAIPEARSSNSKKPDFLKEDENIEKLVGEEIGLLRDRGKWAGNVKASKNHQFISIADELSRGRVEQEEKHAKERIVFIHVDDSPGVNKTLGKNSCDDFSLKRCSIEGADVFPIPYSQQSKGVVSDKALSAIKNVMGDKVKEFCSAKIFELTHRVEEALGAYINLRSLRAQGCGNILYHCRFWSFSGKEKIQVARKLITNLQNLKKFFEGDTSIKIESFSEREKSALWQPGSELRKALTQAGLSTISTWVPHLSSQGDNLNFLKDLVTHEEARQKRVERFCLGWL